MVETSENRSILTCYKLSDYCSVDEWLKDLWSCSTNADFKQLLLKTPIIAGLIDYCKDAKDVILIEDLKKVCRSLTAECDFITCCLFFWSLYIRENCIGPSIYTEYVEDTRAPLVKGGPLPVTPFDPISNKNEQL